MKVIAEGPQMLGPGQVFRTWLEQTLPTSKSRFHLSVAGSYSKEELLQMADWLRDWVTRTTI